MQLEATKSQHPITLTIDGLNVPFIATVQGYKPGVVKIVSLVLKGSTNLEVLSLLGNDKIRSQAVDQIETIYKETK